MTIIIIIIIRWCVNKSSQSYLVPLFWSLVLLKPRPNDRNKPTQHIATLLGAACFVRLATVLWCVAACWVLLAQVWKRSTLCQQQPTSRNMLHPRMLRYSALARCDRLAAALCLRCHRDWTQTLLYWWRSSTCLWLVNSHNFEFYRLRTTNQRNFADLSTAKSSVWNFFGCTLGLL